MSGTPLRRVPVCILVYPVASQASPPSRKGPGNQKLTVDFVAICNSRQVLWYVVFVFRFRFGVLRKQAVPSDSCQWSGEQGFWLFRFVICGALAEKTATPVECLTAAEPHSHSGQFMRQVIYKA